MKRAPRAQIESMKASEAMESLVAVVFQAGMPNGRRLSCRICIARVAC